MSKRKLVLSKSFNKSYKKFIGKKPTLKPYIENALIILEGDAFSSSLKTHKLSGNLYGYFACSCGYDCRIIFSIEKDLKNKTEIILLVDIGTHDEVY
ncbi:MAG TPA: type II toxin-antitoxin system YafQ family toxin [Hanamia sp.]|jgi:mRNA interferase YafQ|nr:type II toxin-antitoxin system YafQ family toxin [Hanamia sp.]